MVLFNLNSSRCASVTQRGRRSNSPTFTSHVCCTAPSIGLVFCSVGEMMGSIQLIWLALKIFGGVHASAFGLIHAVCVGFKTSGDVHVGGVKQAVLVKFNCLGGGHASGTHPVLSALSICVAEHITCALIGKARQSSTLNTYFCMVSN